MSHTQDIVQKLWNLCHVLRDDGITYQDYVTELTWLLFLKMMQETGKEDAIPKGYRWRDLLEKSGVEQLNFYKRLLLDLGTEGTGRVQLIFADASTSLRHARNLAKLVTDIDALDWYDARKEGLGELYEGLLEKNAAEKKSGAGQYFTPRPLIDCMVTLLKPQPGEYVQDPAAGTGGFLIAADRYVKAHTADLYDLSEAEQAFQVKQAFYGVELVQSAHRLCLMNAMLHGIEGDLLLGDTLSPTGARLREADLILTNPPFGTKKGGGRPTRDDFVHMTSNKQLAFLQHVYRNLRPGGRAGIVVSDYVLFGEGIATKIRVDLMDKCDLHTILRLPTGIFYATGVKTNVLFFTRGTTEKGNTKKVWIYDMRTRIPTLRKEASLTREHFVDFEKAFGDDRYGKSRRRDLGKEGRFRAFTREEIRQRGENLDISWLAIGWTMPLKIFICHCTEDKVSARNIYRWLKEQGYRPWLDEENILPGQDWDREIEKGVQASDVVLLLLSGRATEKVGYIQKEIRYALDLAMRQPEGEIFIIPVRLEKCGVPRSVRHLQYVDLFEDRGYPKLENALSHRSERLTQKTVSKI